MRRFALLDIPTATAHGLVIDGQLHDHRHPAAVLRRLAFAEVADPGPHGEDDALAHLAPQMCDAHGVDRCVAAQLTGECIGDLTYWVTADDTPAGRIALREIPPRDPAELDALVKRARTLGTARKARAAEKRARGVTQ